MTRPVPLWPAARLSAFYAAAFLVTGIKLPFWPIWLAARGLGPQEIALVLAAALWMKVAATPVVGALADRLGRRRRELSGLHSMVSSIALKSHCGRDPRAFQDAV